MLTGRCAVCRLPRNPSDLLRPGEIDPEPACQEVLEVGEVGLAVPNLPRQEIPIQAAGGKRACCLAYVPFHRVKPVAPIRDVRCADVLAGRQQVLHPLWNQCPEWELEWVAADVNIVPQARAGVKIDTVTPDADTVRKWLRADARMPCFDPNVLLEDGQLGPDPSRLANIDVLGQAILGADDVRSQPQFRVPVATFEPGRLGLHPIQHR